MKAKKLVAVGMTVLMLGGLFVGCGNSADTSTGANSGKNVKITIFQSKIEANEGYKKLIAAYEKDHPNVEINLEAVTGNDFGASMKAKMQSDPPTIFSVGGFSDMKDYGDVIEDVSDLDIMQHALKGTTDTFTKDGKVYAIPLYMEGYGFVINKQMFEDAGVSVDSMMNFEGMKAGFDTLREKIDNGEMKDKYPNLEAVMEYPTKELWIAGDHDANVALTHDFKTPNEAYAADSLPGTGFEDYKKMVDFQASYTTNANNTAINVQSEVNDPDSLYNYYKRLIQCYHDHADIVRQAEFRPMYEEYLGLFAYEREVNGKGLLVIVNFTNEKLMFQKIDQKCELCNYHETESEWLQPYEARIYSK